MTTRRVDVSGPGFSDDDSPPASNLSSMQRAIVTIQKMRAKIETLERARIEPIAIIGMGCRIPGGANTPEAFFKLLEDGVDAVSEVPPDRWHIEPEGPNSEGEARALRWGAFLKNIDLFDASFFGISPREAESLDPQHRLLLEVTWEALERAGQLPERIMGTKAGVFVGIWAPDYQLRVLARDPNELDAYCFTGTVLSTAAGRLSYTLGLQGPCMSIDTACSSSLTAIHLACQSLRSGESTMAIAGGVNLMLAPTTTKLLSKTQALSPDGRCKTFDARANGYVRGEGCGMLVLKRLSDAERDGDTILALIRGSAVNQDGRSTGLTAPNVLSQQALLKQALESARLAPQDIAYLEAHGTGTSLGDPIEVEAIKAVLGAPRERGATCVLGALKSNIGHLEAAAGVAGLIKVVLSMQNEKIPGNLHFRSLNPRIDLTGTSLEIAQTTKAWAPGIRQRYAGVSSFGISGTNAHVIIEEAPRNLEEALLEEETSTYLLPISAKTHNALRDHAQAYLKMLVSEQSPRLLDIVHTASARRSHYVHRLSVVGRTKEEMAEQLDAYLRDRAPTSVAEGKSTPARAKIVFVFSGQGSQWLGMGRQLYETDSSFRSVIDTCDNLMTSRLNWSILDELDAPETMSRMGDTQVAQPLLFAIQVALVEMLRSWGISPDAMIGHSVGEIAAAHIAGILSLDEAIRLVSIRGRIMQKATGMGKMVSVAMTPDDAAVMLAGYEDRVSIAAINDPDSVVLSGSASALEDVVLRCEKRGFASRALRVDYAFHSPQMDGFERELVDRLVRVDTRRATLAMYSTVLADCVDGKELDVRYWGRNVRQTVDFSGAVFAAIRDGYQLFLEMGPHPVLTGNIQQCLAAKKTDGAVSYTMRRKQDQRRTLLEAIGTLYTRGCLPEWTRVVPSGGKSVPLPTYPWQRERHWIDDVVSPQRALQGSGLSLREIVHPLLGMKFSVALHSNTEFWQQTLRATTLPWLGECLMHGMVVFPAAAYIEMAVAATTFSFGDRALVIDDLVFVRTLGLPASVERLVQVALTADGELSDVHVASRDKDAGPWTTHAMCRVAMAAAEAPGRSDTYEGIQARCSERISSSEHYARLEARGFEYGQHFRGVQEVWVGKGEAIAQISLPTESKGTYRIHPAMLDCCFQVAVLLATASAPEMPLLPVRIARISWWGPTERNVWVHAVLSPEPRPNGTQAVDFVLWNDRGEVVAEVEGFALGLFEPPCVSARDSLAGCVYGLEWRMKPLGLRATEELLGGAWLVVADSQGAGMDLVTHLRAHGQRCIVAFTGNQFEQIDAERYQFNPRRSDDMLRLVQDTCGKTGGCQGAIHLLALDAAPFKETTTETLVRDEQQVVASALSLAQSLLHIGARNTPKLVLVTRAACNTGQDTEPVSPSQASLWGLARTISLEHPDLDCTCVDLPHNAIPDEIDTLANELLLSDGEIHVALRHNGRYVARLVAASFDAGERRAGIRSDATYWITGGLGGLGLSLASWMVHQGARHLVLLGRNAPSEGAGQSILEMTAAGADVRSAQADISRPEDVQAVFVQTQLMPPLRGIVHAAAVLDDHTLMQLNADHISRVFAPKARGAWNLHAATQHMPLDFFILYSSATALLGSPGQSNYSAANAFLDALAQARRAVGLPAVSIQWGPFSGVGMAAALEERGGRLARRGLDSLSPDEGTRAFAHILNGAQPTLAVMRLSVRQWLESYPQAGASPFLSELRKEGTKTTHLSPGGIRQEIERMAPEQRFGRLERHVLDQLGRVIRAEASRIDPQASFTSLGIDSLMSIELRNRLESSLGMKLQSTLLFTYANPSTLAEHLSNQLIPRTSNTFTQPEDRMKSALETMDLEEDLPEADDDLLAAFDASVRELKSEMSS